LLLEELAFVLNEAVFPCELKGISAAIDSKLQPSTPCLVLLAYSFKFLLRNSHFLAILESERAIQILERSAYVNFFIRLDNLSRRFCRLLQYLLALFIGVSSVELRCLDSDFLGFITVIGLAIVVVEGEAGAEGTVYYYLGRG